MSLKTTMLWGKMNGMIRRFVKILLRTGLTKRSLYRPVWRSRARDILLS